MDSAGGWGWPKRGKAVAISEEPGRLPGVDDLREPIGLADPKRGEAREISFAELARRGIETILSLYSDESAATQNWQPPKPRKLGWMGLTDAEIKLEAQRTHSELSVDAPDKR